MMTDEPVNQALVDRLQRNIDDAEEKFKGFVVGRRLRNLVAAARKRRGEDVGEVREKPAFGEPDTQPVDQPAGDQGIDLGGMFATGTKKAKSFAAASENNTDDDASEDVEVQESAQDEASIDSLPEYQSAFDILDGLHKDGIA